MNSSHASWFNLAAAIIVALLPVLANTSDLPTWVFAAAFGINAFLHVLLPDAPGGLSMNYQRGIVKMMPLLLLLGYTSCNLLPTSVQTDLTKFFTGLAKKQTADLNVALAIANAATPVDKPGADCATSLLAVQSDINAVIVAAGAPGAGAISAAEVASLFQPGSVQANNERDKLVAGCSVKVAQVSGAIAGTTAWLAQLATMFAIPIPGA